MKDLGSMTDKELYKRVHERDMIFEKTCPRCNKNLLSFGCAKELREYKMYDVDICYCCNLKEGNVDAIFDMIDKQRKKEEREIRKKNKKESLIRQARYQIEEEKREKIRQRQQDDWWNDMWSMW